MTNILSYIHRKILKTIKVGTYSAGGRNHSGHICVFHRGGANKSYKILDIHRRINLVGFITKIIYDAVRTAYLAFILYQNGFLSLIIITEGKKIGDKIFSGSLSKLYNNGSTILLNKVKNFSNISCIETRPSFGAALVRSAGNGALLLHFNNNKAVVKLRSGWIVYLSLNTLVTLGFVSNSAHNQKILYKAGVSRGQGFRPSVRGVAMNPVDHPHGGGNGKSNNPALAVNAWGRQGKGVHTKRGKKNKLLRRLYLNKK